MKSCILVLLLLSAIIAPPLLAHDLTDREVESIGNSIEIGIWDDLIYVDYWIAIGDLEALNFYPLIDENRDGSISEEEKELFLETLEKDVIRKGVQIVMDGRNDLSFALYSSSIKLEAEENAPVPIKINFEFLLDIQRLRSMGMLSSDLKDHSLIFYMTNILKKPVWTKLFIAQGEGINVIYSPEQRENALLFRNGFWLEPNAWNGIKLNYREVGRDISPEPVFDRPAPGDLNKAKHVLINYVKNPSFLLLALFIAFIYGAGHALTPGHGKTLVAAYLIGSRGTIAQAILLGLTVTATHLATVIIAGVLALTASHYINQTAFSFYLGITSGLIIIFMGVWILSRRLAHPPGAHNHQHTHSHTDNTAKTHNHDKVHSHSHAIPALETVSFKQILALGISGGIVPCPTAIVILLMAITLKKTLWGLSLILAFSLGLAGVLIAIGILMVTGVSLLDSSKRLIGIDMNKVFRLASILSPILITLIGAAIIVMNLINSGLIILNPAALP
jgi:ABC-type nickel/cobalt efflux system permease component RcnA